jgi:hypothetical protein
MRAVALTLCAGLALPLCLCLCLEGPAAATAQIPDELLYKGKKHALFSTPLEDFWSRQNPRPKSLRATSTACWRGYSARWALRGGYLQLQGINPCHHDDKPLSVASVLPGKKLPLRATWFTGVLRVPLGKQLQYVHLGFHSTYEKDLLLWIRAGKLVAKRLIDNRPGKRTVASKPRPEQEIAAGLAAARAYILRSCFPVTGKGKGAIAKKPPEVVLLKLKITAHGAPAQVEVVDRLPVAVSACIRATVMLMARFPVTDGQVSVQHWLKLR